jgi:hypothetical protein
MDPNGVLVKDVHSFSKLENLNTAFQSCVFCSTHAHERSRVEIFLSENFTYEKIKWKKRVTFDERFIVYLLR